MSSAAEDVSGAEEGIMVAIRMRPLNTKEKGPDATTKSQRVWRVLQKHNSVAQCTAAGKPLPERIANRNFFQFDKAFAEVSTTRQVYDEVAKGIVGSVTNGLNGTIFAYGQTSSGKTFTMQGSGSLESASNLNTDGGIVHMAASDIFQHIEANTDRVFLVRVSFIEIYNEEVRDLLVSGGEDNTLSVREDPRRGVFVNSNESIVTGLDSLLSVLFAGEKNRSVASTGMNERSSRSHTIFRITVESRLKNVETDDTENEDSDEEMEDVDDGELSNGNGAVRVSTLNLVDLAGSESVRHTGATGDRQKEGGKINQSLLTLSRVISSLGQQNATHINFRDSKLTRILQPSLSGNARMAVICCATPSELYLEETRSTLQFASRAKLVKTRAQVNEVLDDRSLIKKLQRELKEARDAGNGHANMDKMKALEEKAVTEAEGKRKAEEDLKRMKDLILKGGVLPTNILYDGAGTSSLFKSLFPYNDTEDILATGSSSFLSSKAQKGKSKRRYSDGAIKCPSPFRDVSNDHPERVTFSSPKLSDCITKMQAKTEMKKKPKSISHISISALTEENDVDLLRKALTAKSSLAQDLRSKLSHAMGESSTFEQKLQNERGEKEMLRLAKEDLEHHVVALVSDKEFVMTEKDINSNEKETEIKSYLRKLQDTVNESRVQAEKVNQLNALVESLQHQIEALKQDHAAKVETLNTERTNELAEVQSEISATRNQMETMQAEHIAATVALKEEHTAEVKALQDEHEGVVGEVMSEIDALRSQMEEMRRNHASELEELKTLHDGDVELARSQLSKTNDLIEQLKNEHSSELDALERVHNTAIMEAQSEKEALEVELSAKEETCQTQASELEQATSRIMNLESSIQETEALFEQMKSEKAVTEEDLAAITSEKEELASKCREQADAIQKLELCAEELKQSVMVGSSNAASLNSQITKLTEKNVELESTAASLEKDIEEKTEALKEATKATVTLGELVEEMKATTKESENKVRETESRLASVEAELETANSEKAKLAEDVELLKSAKKASEEHLGRLNKAIAENDSSNTQQLAELSASLQLSQEEAESFKSDLSKKTDTINELEEKLTVTNNHLEIVSSEKEALQAQRDALTQDLSALKAKQAEVQEYYEAQMKTTKAEVVKVTEANATLASAKESLEAQLSKLTNEKDAMSARVEEFTAKINEVTSERDNIAATLESLQSGSESAAQIMDEMTSKVNELEGQVGELQAERDHLQADKKSLEENVRELRLRIEGLEGENEVFSATINQLQSEKETAGNTIAELAANNQESQQFVARPEAEKSEVISSVEVKHKEISALSSQKEALESSLSELQVNMQELNKAANEANRLEALAKEATEPDCGALVEREETIAKLTEQVSEQGMLIENLNSQISQVTLELESVTSAKDEMSSELETCTAKIATLQNELSSKSAKLAEMESTVNILTTERDAADARINELLEGDGESMVIVQSLQDEKAALVVRVEETVARLDTEKETLQSTITDLSSSNLELQQTVNKLTAELSTTKTEVNELLEIAEKSEADYKSLLIEKEECLNELEDAIEQLNEAEIRHSEEISKLQQVATPSFASESEDVIALKKEVDELKVLLASANSSVDEARDAALKSDEDLEAKETQLEQALKEVADAQVKIRHLQSALGSVGVNTESEELLKEMEILMSEKADAESRLEVELSKRKEIEDEFQRAADEEKQTLMMEAEEKMVLLRDEISQLRSDLSRVESELYATKDEIDDLRGENQRSEARANEMEVRVSAVSRELGQAREANAALRQQLDQLHEESTSFKSQAFSAKAAMEAEFQDNLQTVEEKLSVALTDLSASQCEIKHLNGIIEDLSSNIEQYKQQLSAMKDMESTENDIEASRLREELAKAKIDLSTLKSDYLSAKNEVAAAKEKIAQVKTRESEKCLALAEKARVNIDQLNDRLRLAEAKANQGGSSEEVESLNRIVKEKDARIKKLEKTKMTKQQVEKIRIMKEEHARYKEQAIAAEQRVYELERELAANSRPRRKGLRERTADEDNDDADRQQDELNQCNQKLRKYVQHSQRLEKERDNALAVISSNKVEDLVGSNLEELVSALCEKLSAIEEECDALAASEEKASKYLSELDSLRKRYAELEGQAEFYKSSNDELSNAHADCKASLKEAQEKIAGLTRELKSLQASNASTKDSMAEMSNEQRRQMQWLEKENLQLGNELKKAKKELLQTKSQFQHSAGNDEATSDLFGLTDLLETAETESSTSKRKPFGSISKNPAGSEMKRRRLQMSNVKKTAEKKREPPANEKENTQNAAHSPLPSSAKKQRKINPFSSVKKASRKLTQAFNDDGSPKHVQLGEGDEPTTELTSDCAQQ